MRGVFSAIPALFLALSPVAVCAADLDAVKSRGVLRVAVAPLAPFVVRDEAGEFAGFEIDAMSALGEEWGVAIEYVEKPFCELVDAVVNDEADMIASGFSNTAERRRILDFSLPYHDTEYFLVIDKAAAKRGRTLRGLNNEEVRIGYQIGGVSGVVAEGEFSGSNLKGFSSFAEVLAALRAGELEGAVMFEPYIGEAEGMKGRQYRVPHEFALTRTIEAYAVAPDSDQFIDALNSFVIARDLEGYWQALEEKWFSDARDIAAAPAPHQCAAAIPQG